MNAIVVVALKRPYTFVVLAILILLFGTMAVFKTPTDIFPPIKIPVVAVIWTYNGLMPADMSGRVVYYYERALTTTVANIEHIESQSLYGSGIVKIFFQPGTDVAAAQAQVTAISQTVIKQLPAGITPPVILVFDASSVPVLDLQIAADNMTPSDIYNVASNLIRPALVSVPGVAIPAPYGGTQANVEVDLDPPNCWSTACRRPTSAHALANQNIVLPAGDQKIGAIDYMVETNATPIAIDSFNNMPIKQVGNAVVYLRDVAYVHRGGPPQQNAVLVKGQQSILLEILKSGDASTLAVVSGVRAKLPQLLKTLPPGVTITPLNDASTFVRASIEDVVQEMVTAACLAGIDVLLFVGSLALHPDRRHLHSAVDPELDPGAVLAWPDHQRHDAGRPRAGRRHPGRRCHGDDREHQHPPGEADRRQPQGAGGRDHRRGQPDRRADVRLHAVHLHRLAAAAAAWRRRRLPVPAAGRGHHLRDDRLLHPVAHLDADHGGLAAARPGRGDAQAAAGTSGPLHPLPGRLRGGASNASATATAPCSKRSPHAASASCCCISAAPWRRCCCCCSLGQDFFPSIKSGEIDLHMRAPIGTRIEESGKIAVLVEQQIRDLLPGHVTAPVNCGLPVSGINQAYSNTGTVGSQDCDITISLDNQASPVARYRKILRAG